MQYVYSVQERMQYVYSVHERMQYVYSVHERMQCTVYKKGCNVQCTGKDAVYSVPEQDALYSV